MKSGKIKFILLTIFVIFFAAESFAWKAKSDTTLYVSPWGGASYANIMGYTNPTYSFTDWSAGIDVEYKFTQEIALKSGISLINKGFKINNEYFDVLMDEGNLFEDVKKEVDRALGHDPKEKQRHLEEYLTPDRLYGV